MDNISTDIICQWCTEIAINCYKFIQRCTNNFQQLLMSIESLQRHTTDIKKETDYVKSLFLALDTSNYNVNLYYDNNHNCNSPFMRFQNIQKESKQYFIEIEFEADSICNYKEDVKTGKSTKRKQALLLSDIIHDKNDLNNFKCKSCLKLYPTAMKLKQHYLRVHAPKKFKCSKCPRSFGTLLLFNRHTKDSHCSVVCSQCGKMYTNTYSLRHHEQSHKFRLVCHSCGKVYKGKGAFNNHIQMKLCEKMRKTNAEAKFACDYCEKKYSQKTALSVHIRLEHENGKALICDWCGKKLSSISRLKDHILKHTKQKNFECGHCGGKFVTKTSLLYHTRTHTGEKPYKCQQCDMTFLSASRRSEHVKRHHTATSFECDICNGKYKGTTCLIRHRKRHFDINSRLYKNPQAPLMVDNGG